MATSDRPAADGDSDGDGEDEGWVTYCPVHNHSVCCGSKQTAAHLKRIHNNSPGVCPESRAVIGRAGAIRVERTCDGDGCDHITEKRFLAEGEDGKLRCSPCDKRYTDALEQEDGGQ